MIFLDFETRSRVDLIKAGSTRYAQDPSTEIICLAWAIDDEEPRLWVQGQEPPKTLLDYVRRGTALSGWNALSFERNIWHYVAAERLGWAEPRLDQWHDTMHDALALALPAALEQCAEALPIGFKKDPAGRKLITKLCKPISNGKHKGEFRLRRDFPDDFANFYKYCKQDVRVERSVYRWLPRHVKGQEREIQLMTSRINDRGVAIDLDAVNSIIRVLGERVDELDAECREITGGYGVRQRDRLLDWLNERGVDPKDSQGKRILDNNTVEKLLKRPSIERSVQRVLTLRHTANRASVAKFRKILLQVCSDGRIHDNVIYHKASTGRYSGAGVQLQNLPRLAVSHPDNIIRIFKTEDLDFIKMFGEPIDMAAALVRPCIIAEKGKKFIDSDLSKIEAIGTAWIAKEEKVLDSHRRGEDNYKATASMMFGISYDEVDSEQRQMGKVAELSGGFGGGAPAIMKGAEKGGQPISKEKAEAIKVKFRRARKKLVSTWYSFGHASIKAMKEPGTTCPVKANPKFQFKKVGSFLYMALPNRRLLAFPFPKIKIGSFRGMKTETVEAMWVDNYTKKWVYRSIRGANFFQSAVQAMCRDILMEAHLRIEVDKQPVVLSVHDESVSEVPDNASYTVEHYNYLMKQVPEWCNDMPINANGWEGFRYKKD